MIQIRTQNHYSGVQSINVVFHIVNKVENVYYFILKTYSRLYIYTVTDLQFPIVKLIWIAITAVFEKKSKILYLVAQTERINKKKFSDLY
jgi:hypothetical protein